jgi:prevent-host-death family protein
MSDRLIGATEFKASCLEIIRQINRDQQRVTITRHGTPVAQLLPIARNARKSSIIGVMKGSVLRYDAPFAPAHLIAQDAQD